MKKMFSFFVLLTAVCAVGCSDNPETDIPEPVEPDIVFDGGEVPAPVLMSDGESVTIGFTATTAWSASINKSADWLTLNAVSGPAGHTELVLTAAPNEGYNERSGVISLWADTVRKDVTVVQKQKDALLATSNQLTTDYEGGTITVEYQTNVGEVTCEVEAAARDWIVPPTTGTRAMQKGSLTLEVLPNTSESTREGKVTFASGTLAETLTVTQLGRTQRLIVSQTEYRVSATVGTLKIEVQTNVDATLTAEVSDEWIRLDKGTRAVLTPAAFLFSVDDNESSQPRTATVTFKVGELSTSVTVTQQPKVEASALFVWPNDEVTDGITRAFPGAEGGGMFTTGGRGGRVIHVTTLEDDVPGSLREALNVKEPRTIVFDVAGDIILKENLSIGYDNVTVAGQTAPGDGICIRGGTVFVGANNVILRYLRFRLGDESRFLSDGSDAIWGRYKENIILDHCSMSWSVDEVASFYANRNFTMQWCLLGEAMANSVHGKGGHGYGGIWGGKNASFHHNLLAHNNSRNARIDHPQIYGNFLATHRGNVDYRNNVIYNWGDNNTYGGEGGWFNFVGNYYKPGPASKDRKYFIDANGYYSSGKTQYDYPRLYLYDNVHTKYPEFTEDQTKGVYLHDGTGAGDPANMYLSALLPIMKDDTEVCYTTTHTAAQAYERVLAYAGASLRRDAVDAHIVYDARNGVATYPVGSNGSKNGIIDSQKDVGGWPLLSATQSEIDRVTDSDGDGIPDYYEDLFGLDKEDAEDGARCDFDERYTNLEMYLHYLVQDAVSSQVVGGSNTELR